MKKFHKNNAHLVLFVMIITMVLFSLSCNKTTTEKAEKTLYLYNWTYYTPEGVIEKFEKEFDVNVVLDYFGSNEDMFAKLKAGGDGYDIFFPSQDYTSIMINDKIVLPLYKTKLPNIQYISPLAREKATYDPDMNYSVPYFMGASGIAVNTSKVENYAKDWSIFANKKLKNRMSMLDDMREVLGAALAHLGYSVNSIDPVELKEAQELINKEWKPNLVKFDAEGFAKSFSSSEFYVVQGYAEAIFEELEEDKWDNVDFFLPPNGGPMYLDSMVIPKGAKHVDLAHKFINFIHTPEIYAEFLDRFHFPSSIHSEAMNYTSETPFYNEKDLVNYELKNDLGQNLTLYDEIWQTIRYTD